MKLNQLIAVSQGMKQELDKVFKNCKDLFSKPVLFNGRIRTYEPKNDEGIVYPSESEKVRERVELILIQVEEKFIEVIDLIASQDVANTEAKADVRVDNELILTDVPAVTLIAVQKYLDELAEKIRNVPILDQGVDWIKDEHLDCWKSKPTIKNKTTKEQEALVLYPATEHGPAQTQLVTKDVIEGKWTEHKLSTAWSHIVRNAFLKRIKNLKDAVVIAREEANSITIEKKEIGEKIFEYLNKAPMNDNF